jgi:hypothetical protein
MSSIAKSKENFKASSRTYIYYCSDFHMVSTTTFEGSSLGDNFTSSTDWLVSPAAPTSGTPNSSTCRLHIVAKNEYRGRMFKGSGSCGTH